ncbi:MAG: RIP metalloprotease RseP [Candidatus Neomarinimicrobiota bacterium]
MTTLWATITVLGVLITVHELGHYLAARSIGVKVHRFSIGFPPRLITLTSIADGWEFRLFFYSRNEKGKLVWGPIKTKIISRPGRKGTFTEYCLAIVPLGGYVKVAGMIDEGLDADIKNEPGELNSKPKWAQIWFMSAGVIMNTLLALFIFTGVALYTGRPVVSAEPVISELVPDMPAKAAGLKPGDRIIEINGKAVNTWAELTEIIHALPDQEIKLVYEQDGREAEINVLTKSSFNQETGDLMGLIGIYPQFHYEPVTVLEGISAGLRSTKNGFGLLIVSIKMISSGKASIRDLGGPIMIAQMAGETARAGWIPLLLFMALISCNLAFINVLPIPGLDGGHIFITLIEGVIRRPLTVKMRMAIQQVGMALLLILMVTVIVNDIGRLFTN